MNLLLLDPRELEDDVVLLEGRRARHLLKVLRVEEGQTLRAGVLGGERGSAEVLAIEGKAVRVHFQAGEESREGKCRPGPAPDVDLVVGMPRPQVLHRVLQTCAAMFVRRLDLTNAWRVEKSYFQSPSAADDAIRRQLRLGAEQGMTTHLPEVRLRKLFVPFVESLDPPRAAELRLVAHPDAAEDLEEVLEEVLGRDDPRWVCLAVGPEGGWIDREVDTLGQAGFRPVSLGPWVLRVEVAVAAALAQLHQARQRRRREAG